MIFMITSSDANNKSCLSRREILTNYALHIGENFSDHYPYQDEDDGNPIYHTVQDYDYYYTYDVDRWFFNRDIISQNNDKTPVEPSYTLADKERVGKSEITYYIHIDKKFTNLIKKTL